MRRLLPAIALLTACAATDNHAIIADLEDMAGKSPRPALLARVVDPAPYRLVGPSREVTLPLAPGKAPIVRARINGVDMECIIDTGTTHVVLSGAAAKACRLYLPAAPTVTIVTPGYEARFHAGAPESIEIGGMRLEGGIAIVPETRTTLSQRLGVRGDIHATIGTAVLSNFNVILDFGKRELVLVPHGCAPFAGIMWTEVRINGLARLMLIDSGANGLFLEPEYALALGLIGEREAKRLRRKAEHAERARFGSVKLRELTLGSKTFLNIHARVVEVTEQPDRGGLLGIAGLGPHRWMIDYEHKRLVLIELR